MDWTAASSPSNGRKTPPPNLLTIRVGALAPIVFLGHQLSVPSQNGIRGDDAAKLSHRAATHSLANPAELSTLRVGKSNPAFVEHGAEKSILCLQVFNGLLLLTVCQWSSESGDFELE